MKLYNTLTRSIEDFTPINENVAKIYTCGPTVYSYQHIGNYTAYIYWDFLVRALTENGYKITRIMNLTDVGHLVSDADEGEDKLDKTAKLERKTAWEIAERYGDDFLKNFRLLRLVEPTKITKATDYIEADLDLIRELKQRGYTYQTSDGIYYDTSKFPRYPDFAKLDIDKLKAGARVKFNSEKRNSTDFALWKFERPEENRDMKWETPLEIMDSPKEGVMGFPGWHIECSSIIKTELGDTIDIHTGGIDHIPVHHTNEIAQSEAVSEKPLANYWLHNNFITVDDKKISKSLGNTYTFKDLKEHGFSHMDYKMWTLQGHFRSERNFSFDNLQAAQNHLNNWRNIAILRHQINETIVSDREKDSVFYALPKIILKAVSNNLNTAESVSIIDEAFSKLENSNIEDINHQSLTRLIQFIDNIFGLDLIDSTPDINEDAKKLIIERNFARESKDWEKSDELRGQLRDQFNIELLDRPSKTIWQYINY